MTEDALFATRRKSSVAVSHAPRVTVLRRVLGPFYFTGVFWYRLHLFAVRVLPDLAKRALVPVFTTTFLLALGGVRRAVGRNLELVLGELGAIRRWRLSWKLVETFSWCLTERYEQFVPGLRFESDVEGIEHWNRALAEDRGFILATGHIGGWELGSTMPITNSEMTVHLVREPELDDASQAFSAQLLRELGGARYHTHYSRGEVDLGLELFEALRDGGIVAATMDRARHGGGVIEGDAFGVPWSFPRGIPTLARLSGSTILPVFMMRVGRRSYRVVFREPITITRTADREADCRVIVGAFAEHLEWAIREDPMQWFCFKGMA